jgi:hypothetical protein
MTFVAKRNKAYTDAFITKVAENASEQEEHLVGEADEICSLVVGFSSSQKDLSVYFKGS